MSLERNKIQVEAMIAAINGRDLDSLDEVVAADVVRHCQATPDVTVANLDDFKAFLRQDFAMVPDSVVEIHHLICERELVSVWCTYSGTQEGAFGPFPPTGKRFSVDFGGHLRIDDGKIAEMWVTWDNLAALVQLGHIDPGGA